jgi:hypothetical protein
LQEALWRHALFSARIGPPGNAPLAVPFDLSASALDDDDEMRADAGLPLLLVFGPDPRWSRQRGRVIRACRACGRHATSDSRSLVAGHRFPRDIILLAVRYYLQLGAAAERIAGSMADRGVDVSGRTILRWLQKFGPALSDQIRRCRKPVSTTWLVDETYVKIRHEWHYLFRGVDGDGQVLDCWLSRTRELAAAESLLPPYRQLDRVHAGARRDRQSHLLSVSDPHVRARRQAYRHRLLQPGDLDQSL